MIHILNAISEHNEVLEAIACTKLQHSVLVVAPIMSIIILEAHTMLIAILEAHIIAITIEKVHMLEVDKMGLCS